MKNKYLMLADLFLVLLIFPGLLISFNTPIFFTFLLIGTVPLLNLLEKIVKDKVDYLKLCLVIAGSSLIFSLLLLSKNNILGMITMFLIMIFSIIKGQLFKVKNAIAPE